MDRSSRVRGTRGGIGRPHSQLRHTFARAGAIAAVVGALLVNSHSVGRAAPAAGQSSPTALSAMNSTNTGIHLGLPQNYDEPTVNGVKQAEVGVVDYVWGASNFPNSHNLPGGTAWHELYIPWGMQAYGAQEPNTAWFQANHPDWLMYLPDRATVAYQDASHAACGCGPSLDYTSSAVRQYIIDTFVNPAFQQGFQGISFDQGLLDNIYGAAGHYDTSGHWVQQYTGSDIDSAWASAQETAFQQMVQSIKALHPSMTITLNQPLDCGHTVSDWNSAVAKTDQVFEESGFTSYGDSGTNYATTSKAGNCSNEWLTKVQQYITLQKKLGKALFLVNQEPYTVTSYMTDTDSTARADLQWALATYLLVKYNHTYFWFGGRQQYGGAPLLQHELNASIGQPSGDMVASQNVYMRKYSNGMAIVNPSPSASYRVTFTSGAYQDLYGNPVNQYTLPPHSGLTLLSKGSSSVTAHFTAKPHSRTASSLI